MLGHTLNTYNTDIICIRTFILILMLQLILTILLIFGQSIFIIMFSWTNTLEFGAISLIIWLLIQPLFKVSCIWLCQWNIQISWLLVLVSLLVLFFKMESILPTTLDLISVALSQDMHQWKQHTWDIISETQPENSESSHPIGIIS